MNLDFNWLNVVSVAFGGQIVLLSVAGWLGRRFVIHRLDRNRIEFENEVGLKRYKGQVTFSRLDEKRAEVIAEVYALLIDFERNSKEFLHPVELPGEPSREEKYQLAFDAWVKFQLYFAQKRLYRNC